MRAIPLVSALVVLAVLTAALWVWIDRPTGIALAGGGAASLQGRGGVDLAADAQGARAGAQAEENLARVPLAGAEPESAPPARTWKSGDQPQVRGRVVNPEGTGVAGASVLAATGSFWISVPLDVELEGLPNGWFEVERTITDADGRYAFETLKPGTLRLVARAAGFAPTRVDDLELLDRPEYEVDDLVLRPGVFLSGRVIDRERKAVGGATLYAPLDCGRDAGGNEVSFPGRGVPLATTDADGGFTVDQLAPGPWTLVVDAPGFAVAEESGSTRRAGDRVSELVFRVERGYEMLGRVRAEDGELPKSLRVSARPSPEQEGRRDEEESSELPTASAQRVRHAFCEPDGTFAVGGLQPDTRYALSLWVRDTEAEAVEDGPPRKSWKLARGTERIHGFSGQRGLEILFRPEAALLFRVTDAASGLPLTEFTVSAGIGNERVLRDDADKARRAFEDGRVRYGGLRPKRGGKPVHLRVAAAGFADHERKDIVLAPAQTLDLGEIALARERVVIARAVDDRTGEPIEGARIVLGTKTEKELKQVLANQPGEDLLGIQTVRFGRTDASGTARLSSYPGKSATAVADAKGRLASAPVSVFLPQGEDKAIELRLRRGGTVVVTVRDRTGRPMEGIGVERRDPSGSQSRHSPDDGENTIRTDAEGVVRFEALEPGAYAFRATDQALPQNAWYSGRRQENNEGWVEAVATEGATVSLDFTVESRGGLSGHVREGGLPLAGARLRLVEPEKAGGNRMVFWGGQNDPLATLTDVNGEYRFSKVRAGPYVLEITHGSRKMVARQPVVVEAPPRVLEIDLDVAIIEGRVVGEDRNPIEGIEVQCLNEKNQNESQGSWRVLLSEDEEGDTDVDYRQDATRREKTDANGRYVLRGVRSGEALKIQASGDTVQPETKEAITLGPDEIRRNVDFVLKDAGAIEVVMTGATSRRGRGWFQVRATQIVEEGKGGQTSYANLGSWNPTAVVRSLPPGRFRVQVFVGGRQQGEAVLDQEVEVVVRQVVRVSFSAP